MNSLDLQFLSAVLHEKAFSNYKPLIFDIDIFDTPISKEVWKFLIQHWTDYAKEPSVETVNAKFDLELEQVKESGRFYYKEMQDRWIFGQLGKLTFDVDEDLKKNEPRSALTRLRESSVELLEKLSHSHKQEFIADINQGTLSRYYDAKAGKTGILSPWKTLNEWCISGDSKIYDAQTGLLVRMDDHCESKKDKIFSFDVNNGFMEKKTTFKGKTGFHKCIKFITSLGKELIGTPVHPVLTPRGWVKMRDLVVGDSIATVAKYPIPEKIKKIPRHYVRIIAMLLSDGNYNGSHIRVANTDEEIISELREIAEKFNCDLKQDHIWWRFVCRKKFKIKRDKKGRAMRNGSIHPVRVMLERYGMNRVKGKDKRIPDIIFQLSEAQIAEFLAAYWNCDGCVSICGSSLNVTVNTVSGEMAKQLQHLLLRLGIVSSIHRVAKEKIKTAWLDQYRINILADYFWIFKRKIKLIKRKYDVFYLDSATPTVNGRAAINIGSKNKERLKTVFLEKKSTGGTGSAGSGISEKIYTNTASGNGRKIESFNDFFSREKTDRINRQILKSMITALKVDEMDWIVSDDIHWDEVSEINPFHSIPVYDVTVPSTHCFVANDIIVHNTRGFFPKDVSWLVARTSQGKSWFILLLANYARTVFNENVLLISCEMSKEDMTDRYMAIDLKIPYGQMRSGKLGVMDELRLEDGIKAYNGKVDIEIIDGEQGLGIERIEEAIIKSKATMVFIDSAYRIKPRQKTRDRFEAMAIVADDIKLFAQMYKKSITCSTQLNRAATTKKTSAISTEDVAMSDNIGWNATNIFALAQTEDSDGRRFMGVHPVKVREASRSDEPMLINWDFVKMDFSEQEYPIGNTGDKNYKMGRPGAKKSSDDDDDDDVSSNRW